MNHLHSDDPIANRTGRLAKDPAHLPLRFLPAWHGAVPWIERKKLVVLQRARSSCPSVTPASKMDGQVRGVVRGDLVKAPSGRLQRPLLRSGFPNIRLSSRHRAGTIAPFSVARNSASSSTVFGRRTRKPRRRLWSTGSSQYLLDALSNLSSACGRMAGRLRCTHDGKEKSSKDSAAHPG